MTENPKNVIDFECYKIKYLVLGEEIIIYELYSVSLEAKFSSEWTTTKINNIINKGKIIKEITLTVIDS